VAANTAWPYRLPGDWLNASTRASFTSMHAPPPANPGFKRQVVFRLGLDDWPLLEAAAREHGSIQAAVLAGLRALDGAEPIPVEEVAGPCGVAAQPADVEPPPAGDPDAELTAREAAALLGLKPSTIRGYIRSGRMPGRYDGEPGWGGWMTTRGAVEGYRTRGS
jgi:hypothetical protein